MKICLQLTSKSLSKLQYGSSIEVFFSTISQWASARKRSDLSMLMALCLASLILLTAVATVNLRALDMSLIPRALRRRLTVVALKSNVRITIPAVWNSTCKQLTSVKITNTIILWKMTKETNYLTLHVNGLISFREPSLKKKRAFTWGFDNLLQI